MELFQHITQDTLILTPNRRLAAHHLKQYQQYQVTQGKLCWHSLDILPFNSWLIRTWKEYTNKEISAASLLLSANQELVIWEDIISQSEQNHLLQVSETAEIAKSAWGILKQWQVPLNHPSLQLTEDSHVFLTWAKQFQKYCKKNHWLDQYSVADLITESIRENKIPAPIHIIMLGFTEISPQNQTLLNCCKEFGTQIIYYQQKRSNNHISRISLNDKENEIRTMARWSKQLLSSLRSRESVRGDDLSIGCIIPNLEDHRPMVSRIFSEVFTEEGFYTENPLSLPFNISAGRSLASYPIIHTALLLLGLHSKALPVDTLSNLLHSPFLGDAEKEAMRRADFANQLQNDNLTRISISDLLNKKNKPELLAKRLKKYLDKFPAANTKLKISEWVNIFTEILNIVGWPGERSVNSEEYQSIQRWMELFSEFSALEHILPAITYHSALHFLKRLTASTVFQPQSPDAPIQILGMFEAAEIPFDYIWVMGMDDTTWPPTPKPNPFIPQQLQKMLQMPHATAERELSFCHKMTEQLKNCADTVIFSYALHNDDTEVRPSALLNSISEMNADNVLLAKDTQPTLLSYHHKEIISSNDDVAPPIHSSNAIQGGVKIFELQAACPFKAFAELRLYAKPIDPATLGLRAFDRGNIVHKALEFIWAELKTSSGLHAKSHDELRELIHDKLEQAIHLVTGEEAIHVNYLMLEIQRLSKIIWNWLDIEKQRPAFSIYAQEQQYEITIANMSISLRIDRIDELENNEKLIIDYKTGKNNSINEWFGERPDSPQLPLYCLLDPEHTDGIAFATLHPEKIGFTGISKENLSIPSVKSLAESKNSDANSWIEQIAKWHEVLEKLGNDFREGKAEVDPKEELLTCEHCNLKPFCRIYNKMTLSSE